MLSLSGEPPSRTARRPPRSLKQEYHEFLLQRIEEYKNALARDELLEIGDEAVRELEQTAAGQYLLTEVLLLEHVDRIIARRLRLPAFPRWRQRHRARPRHHKQSASAHQPRSCEHQQCRNHAQPAQNGRGACRPSPPRPST